jgi:pilus assembly protein CpaB
MSIRVDEVIGVGGFILPNTYVDIIAVGDAQKGTQREAKTILQRIKVLAIAQETTTEEGKAKVVRTVTMEVAPQEAERLALQTHQGSIHLVLRNPLDEAMEEEKPAPAPRPVVRRPPPPRRPAPVVAPKPSAFEVEVIRGATRQEVKFEDAESEKRVK